MTREEFQRLPYLMSPSQVARCGYALHTVEKYAAHGILKVIQPAGMPHRRFRKLQVAQLLGWEPLIELARWRSEKPLLPFCAVHEWTGFAERTIKEIVAAGGLVEVRPGGVGSTKYRKEEIGAWLGF